MSRDTVINKWLVPSTNDKLERRTSPSGRTMQGRKGVGRYAASILGVDLLLETTSSEGEYTTVYLLWNDFQTAAYLSDVEILVESISREGIPGTKLTIKGSKSDLDEWTRDELDKLKFELRKLIAPLTPSTRVHDEFRIRLKIDPFSATNNQEIDEFVEPFPIFDLYDYKISGTIAENGLGQITYSTQKARNTTEELIPFNLEAPTGCGSLTFDIRAYDRDKEAIESLIDRGLKDPEGNYVGKLQARQLLNHYNGIGVYRNGFRIRPLGDPAYDWLELNKQRVQNPSQKIGSDQVIGYVEIEAEERSRLVEKSARDGLRENPAFGHLKSITKAIIGILEERRFIYRRKAGLSKPVLKIEREMERLFAFEDLKQDIRKRLAKRGVDNQTANEIIDFITKEEDDKNRIANELRQAVAIYQGQATLGKIINVVLHEGRRPLNYFKNQIPNLLYWYQEYTDTSNLEYLKRCIPMIKGVPSNADILVKLFARLDPLAAGKRGNRIALNLQKELHNIADVFSNELSTHQIEIDINCPEEITLSGWSQDLYTIFTNLIDNSIYWISNKNSDERMISIHAISTASGELDYIDFRDSGPGIEKHLIITEVIFEPEFSTKHDGTGLGLAIAGEAAHRTGLDLKALDSDTGAYFRIQPQPPQQ